jgi:hypothetical protein
MWIVDLTPSMNALDRMYKFMGGTSLAKPKGRIMSYTWDDLFYRISLDELRSFGWVLHKGEFAGVESACFQLNMFLTVYDIKRKGHFTKAMEDKYEAMMYYFDTMYDRLVGGRDVDVHVPSLKIGDKVFETVYFYPPINNTEASAGPRTFPSVVDIESAANASSCGLDGKNAGLWTELIKAVYDNPIYVALKDVDWTNLVGLRQTIEQFVFGRPMRRAPLLITNGDYLPDGEALETFVASTLAPVPFWSRFGAAGGRVAEPIVVRDERVERVEPPVERVEPPVVRVEPPVVRVEPPVFVRDPRVAPPAATAAPAAAGKRQRSPSPEITLADGSDSRPASRQRVDDASLDPTQQAIENSLGDLRPRSSSLPPTKFQWPPGVRPASRQRILENSSEDPRPRPLAGLAPSSGVEQPPPAPLPPGAHYEW